MQNLSLTQINALDSTKNKLQLDITPCITLPEISKALNSNDFLSSSSAVDNKSIESITPDDNSYLGLSKVNYDIDFSDLSTENSVAEDLTPEKRKSPTPSFVIGDPFSPIGGSCPIAQTPLVPSSVFPQIESKNDGFVLPFLDDTEENVEDSLLDKVEVAPSASLPAPLVPTSSEYSGFSKQGSRIPNIPCSTGDFSSLNFAGNSNM